MVDTKTIEKASKPASFITQIFDSIETRIEMAAIEAEVAKQNSLKLILYYALAAFFGLFALTFISIAVIVLFWEEHRIFVSCAIAALYSVIFLFFLGKANNLASNMPYAFELSRQGLKADFMALKGAFERTPAATVPAAPADSVPETAAPRDLQPSEDPEKL